MDFHQIKLRMKSFGSTTVLSSAVDHIATVPTSSNGGLPLHRFIMKWHSIPLTASC